MLTSLLVRNFKTFGEAEIELGQTVVFVGPNNSGKTTALQALALWELGLRRWNEKRGGKPAPETRPGVTINRRDLIAIPIPNANLLWRNLHVRDVQRIDGKASTKNVRIDVVVSGVAEGAQWQCGLEFDYANEESFYCRPLRLGEGRRPKRMPVPDAAGSVRVALLPPMSGLTAREDKLEPGSIDVRIGEGRTAEILRNLCHQIYEQRPGDLWRRLCDDIDALFGVALEPPLLIPERGEITMTYSEHGGPPLDLSSAGRGLQQTLLLLAYLYSNPGTVLLLDEPDAHLEILRQRQTYQLLTEIAEELSSQIIIASHSEVLLNEAADRDVVVAFLGRPHRIDDRGSQLRKSLIEIGFDEYYQADQTGWVLYLEGSTDLAILRAFANTLDHPARKHIERPFVHYVSNQPQRARDHFYGLCEARADLRAIAIYDRLDAELQTGTPLTELQWRRREIENYLCRPDVLLHYASVSGKEESPGPLFREGDAARRREVMAASIDEVTAAVATARDIEDPFSPDVKVSDEFLDPLFRTYFKRLGLPNLMQKTDYHVLAALVPLELIDDEVAEKLDAIASVAESARPTG